MPQQSTYSWGAEPTITKNSERNNWYKGDYQDMGMGMGYVGGGMTTKRTSRRVMITPSQKKLIKIVTVIVMTTQREGRNTMKNMKKNMTMIMSILANLCSVGSVNQKLKIFEKSKFDCDF